MEWTIDIENVAGIRSGSATLQRGKNAIQAENWQGKSSLLTAIETALGCDAELTEGAESGEVVLQTDGDDAEHRVRLDRRDGVVVDAGEPYLASERDRVAASLFACLGEGNEIRRRVRTAAPLKEALVKPLDFENIEEQIAELQAERSQVETELERAEAAASRLPSVEEDITDLQSELAELEERRAEREEANGGDGVSEKREELSDALSERNQIESQIERYERSIETTREKIQDARERLESLEEPTVDDDLASEIEELRERLQRTEESANLLQSIYGPMKRLFDEGRLDLVADTDHGLIADTTECWTCGQEASEDQIEAQLERLSERVSEYQRQASEQRERIEELTERRREREEARRQRDSLEREISDLEQRLSEREMSLERSEERLEELEERIEELSAAVEDVDEERTEVESEIKYLQTRVEETKSERDDLEREAERRESLRAEVDDLTEEIHELRERKKRIENRMREAFDEAIRDIVSRFEVGFETARLTSSFELVVARDGREVELDALSDGERELLGIVTALAGFEAYDVGEVVPVLLLDDLGRLSEDNLQTLVDYLDDRSEFLVFTSYPEHSIGDAHRVDPSEWEIATESVGASA